ncbi:MAG: hypothetical protein EZS28_048739 [Streblomastix strix]|uniref:Uncharacterized protein n=1 Tax=Streblomastix strix TaxID=222440 RepID=A0A5J4TBH9_9EUKA|nr:MAG: hypothetical protein EZS28_048739 [Streblomastix strix]
MYFAFSEIDKPDAPSTSEILTAVELKEITDAELEEKVETVSVYARATPADKSRILTFFIFSLKYSLQ